MVQGRGTGSESRRRVASRALQAAEPREPQTEVRQAGQRTRSVDTGKD